MASLRDCPSNACYAPAYLSQYNRTMRLRGDNQRCCISHSARPHLHALKGAPFHSRAFLFSDCTFHGQGVLSPKSERGRRGDSRVKGLKRLAVSAGVSRLGDPATPTLNVFVTRLPFNACYAPAYLSQYTELCGFAETTNRAAFHTRQVLACMR
jgi:hypothetical protein